MSKNMIHMGIGERDGSATRQNPLFRRRDQLNRWQESDTNKILAIQKEQSRVKFESGTSFLAACSSGDFDEVERLLQNKVDINTCNVDGLTALHQACIDNDLDLVKFLIDHKAYIDVRDNEGWTPLHATASCAYMEVAKCLLDSGADVAAVNNDGDLAIDLAENSEMELLLQTEMEHRQVDAEAARRAEEMLMEIDAARWVADGRYKDVRDVKTGASPLHVAAAKGYLRCLCLLLSCPGVDVNACDADGWTPLHAAAHWGQASCCEALVEASASLEVKTDADQSVFELAEAELVPMLKRLRQKQLAQLSCQQENQSDLIATRQPPPYRRKSSVTRISADQKQTKVAQSVEEERQVLEHAHNKNSTEPELPADIALTPSIVSVVDDVAESERLKNRRNLEKNCEMPRIDEERNSLLSNRALKNKVEDPEPTSLSSSNTLSTGQSIPRRVEIITLTEEQNDSKSQHSLKRHSQDKEELEKIDNFKEKLDADKLIEEVAAEEERLEDDHLNANTLSATTSATTTTSAATTDISLATVTMTTVVTTSSDTFSSGLTAQSNHSTSIQKNSGLVDVNSALNGTRRVSTIMEPSKTGEAETQRKTAARRARQSRRSTQGVTEDELKEAQMLLHTNTNATSSGLALSASTSGPAGGSDLDEISSRLGGCATTTTTTTTSTTTSGGSSSISSSTISPTTSLLSDNVNKSSGLYRHQTAPTSDWSRPMSSVPERTLSAARSSYMSTIAEQKPSVDDAGGGVEESTVSVVTEQESDWRRKRRERNERLARQAGLAALGEVESMNSSNKPTDSGRASSLYGATSLDNVRSSGGSGVTGNTELSTSNSRNSSYQVGLDRLHRNSSVEETDWKKLYEKEKTENDRLRRELDRKTSEADEQHKRTEKLANDNRKLSDENAALIRVLSKLSKPM